MPPEETKERETEGWIPRDPIRVRNFFTILLTSVIIFRKLGNLIPELWICHVESGSGA